MLGEGDSYLWQSCNRKIRQTKTPTIFLVMLLARGKPKSPQVLQFLSREIGLIPSSTNAANIG